MIGDILLKIGISIKQCFCIHKYRNLSYLINGGSFEECTKCGRIKG